MQEDKSKFAKLIGKIRTRQQNKDDSHLWKTRMVFLLPFIIAALLFFLLSLKS